MHIQRIDFDEVFDADPGRGDFSFRNRAGVRYGVRLRRGVVPPSGASWLIAFARPDDWSSVLGWAAPGEAVTLREGTLLALFSGAATLAWFTPFLVFGTGYFFGMGAALAVLLALGCWAGLAGGRIVARDRAVRRALARTVATVT
ncbi:hypothetical protein [Massilia haematophila]|uniref:Uncharacterized protein n=1 Tax=Massilia haematophila TaxID=457923 RepID=A0ABV7PIV6_9BURK